MDICLLLMKCWFTLHIVCLYIPSAESSMRPRTGWRGEEWTSVPHPVSLPADTGSQTSTGPEGRQEDSQGTDLDGGFGGFTKRKNMKKGRVRQFGQFNSDTHGCSGIQWRSCSSPSHCRGCLGLYTCNLNLGRCQLKGLSQQTDKFLETLRDF